MGKLVSLEILTKKPSTSISGGSSHYGAGNGDEVEKNFYSPKEGYKRFFDREDIEYYFGEFEIEHCKEERIVKYGDEKKSWEFVVRKM